MDEYEDQEISILSEMAISELEEKFSKCKAQLRAAVELLEIIKEDDLLPMAYAVKNGKQIRDLLEETLATIKGKKA